MARASFADIMKPMEADDLVDGPREHDEGFVYFVQGEQGGPVKVGLALDPEKRLAGLQTGFPYELKLLRVVPGGRALEAAIHKQLAPTRTRGEWFEMSPELSRMLIEPGYAETVLGEKRIYYAQQPDAQFPCEVCGVDLEDAYGEERFMASVEPPRQCKACVEAAPYRENPDLEEAA